MRSILVAMMKSFSCSPLIFLVCGETVALPQPKLNFYLPPRSERTGPSSLRPNLKGGAASKVVGKLLRDGLIEEVLAAAAWRRDDDGNVGSSRIARNRIVETARAGWDGMIRTHKCRFQNWPLKCGPNFPSFRNV